MVRSMTGYGLGKESFPGGTITAEVKSVNNRYLDASVHLPRGFLAAEEPLRQLLRKQIARGKVDLYLTLEEAEDIPVSVSVNQAAAEAYVNAARQAAEDYALPNDLTVTSLLGMPDVLTAEKEKVDTETFTQAALLATQKALSALNAMRETEGENLCLDLLEKTDDILQDVSAAEARSQETVSEYQQRMREKLQKVLEDRQIDEARLITEAAIWADKTCVDEETVRLRSHVSQMRSILQEGGTVGRKLDFLLQEMNREVNTIGSKGNDAEMAKIVVRLKTQLEKIREQIQNLE